MRKSYGGIVHVSTVIDEDLKDRDTGLSKPQRRGLADIAASILTCRNVNTSELANVLPRDVYSNEERYRYINRWLANEKIDPIRVMYGFTSELLDLLCNSGQTAILSLDQSKVRDGFECLMVSLRIAQRAIPVAWRVIETKGEIGFEIQKPLLKAVATMIPEGITVLLAADRFYGTASLVSLCKELGWQYRIRLKNNLKIWHCGEELKTGDLISRGILSAERVWFNSGEETCIGSLHEDGHKEAWIIAMDCKPTLGRVLDYGMRWGIEALFSDMKTRGFGITKTRLKDSKRIERLMLVLAVACYWAVSTGMQPRPQRRLSKKKPKGA